MIDSNVNIDINKYITEDSFRRFDKCFWLKGGKEREARTKRR
jgi:hypothetical protein